MCAPVPGFYDDPVVYDILHTPGTSRDVQVLLRLFRRHCARAPKTAWWLEPACGTGRFLRLLARRGHRVAGFDRSEAMLSYARRRLATMGLSRRVRIVSAEMTAFRDRVPVQDVIFAFNTINTLRHLPRDADYLQHFEEMAGLLRPGGVYVVGISLSAYGREVPTEDQWEGRRGSCRVRQIVQYLPPGGPLTPRRKERVVSHLIIQRPRRTEHRDHSYQLHCFDRRQWHRLLGKSALSIREITDDRGHPITDHDGNYFLYVLERRN